MYSAAGMILAVVPALSYEAWTAVLLLSCVKMIDVLIVENAVSL